MKRSLLLTLAAMLAATNAFADGGSIGVFTDQSATNCTIEQGVSITTVTIVHQGSDGTTGSEFSDQFQQK